MKYLPITGPQAPFKDGPADAEMYSAPGSKTFYYRIASIPTIQFWQAGNWVDLQGDPSYPILGRRRVIAEPNHWTVEDQKAGRLPEVGVKCRQGHKDEIVVAVTEKFVVTECQDMSVCTTRKDVFMRSYNPIETPEEKAQRLRSEWINKAYVDFHRFGCEIEVLQKEQLKQVYDALLSGELPMPSKKGGE